MVNVLEIENVKKEFISHGKTTVAVDNVSLSVASGEFVSIIGCSGSGKSTLLNLIDGILTPTEGRIKISGNDISNIKDMSKLRSSIIGYILQGQNLMPNLTVYENVILPLTFCEIRVDKKAVYDMLKHVSIFDLKDKYPSELSGGEAKRCEIARALLLDPKILLADEPVSDLDPENVEIIMNIFTEYAGKGTSIIMVTHNIGTVNYSDNVYEMNKGILKRRK